MQPLPGASGAGLASGELAPLTQTPGAQESLYWYSLFTSHNNCWQAGEPKESSYVCDNVGASYLPTGPHMAEGAVATDVQLSHSGDYCNYYNIGEGLDTTDANKESISTGYEPPTPLASYQEANHFRSVCQAYETFWGQEVRGTDSSECTGSRAPCGMQHYASLAEQGLNDHPWSGSLGEPKLVVSTDALPFTREVQVGAWGYVCPLLEDETTGNILEYCLTQWTSGSGFPSIAHYDVVGGCASAGVHNLDITITAFAPGTSFATEYPESASTFNFTTNSTWRHFIAGISEADLADAIAMDRKEFRGTDGQPEAGYGCGRNSSLKPHDWALIGIEHGVEGGGLKELGDGESNLQLWTEYAPLSPAVTTGVATGVQQTRATFNGIVGPNATDTHYYFQYGRTPAYGSNMPGPPGNDAGAGMGSVNVNTSVTSLEPGAVYHYRLVAVNGGGTSYGSDQTVRTTQSRGSSWALVESDGTTQDVYYVGSNNGIAQWQWSIATGGWSQTQVGGSAAGNPTALLESNGTTQDVYFRGTDGQIWQAQWSVATKGWSLIPHGGSAAGDPTALLEANGTTQDIYYRGTNGAIWDLQWSATGGWSQTQL